MPHSSISQNAFQVTLLCVTHILKKEVKVGINDVRLCVCVCVCCDCFLTVTSLRTTSTSKSPGSHGSVHTTPQVQIERGTLYALSTGHRVSACTGIRIMRFRKLRSEKDSER